MGIFPDGCHYFKFGSCVALSILFIAKKMKYTCTSAISRAATAFRWYLPSTIVSSAGVEKLGEPSKGVFLHLAPFFRRFKFRYVYVSLLVHFLNHGYAQTYNIWFGGGLRSEALRDMGYSPLVFSGLGLSGMLGYEKKAESKETIWMLNYSQATTNNVFERKLTATNVGLLNLNFYPRENKSFSWGWSNNNALQHRYISGFDNFNGRTDVFTAFGPAVQFKKQLQVKERNFVFSAVSHIQLLGFYLPSGYVSSLPSGFGYEPNGAFKGFWQSIYLFYPGGAFNVAIWPKLEWQLKTGNSIGLQYFYEYTRMQGAQMHERSTGMWLLNFSMKIK